MGDEKIQGRKKMANSVRALRTRTFLHARTMSAKMAWLALTVVGALSVSSIMQRFQTSNPISTEKHQNLLIEKVQQCTITNLHKNLYFLDGATPIKASEFIHRRDRLAAALVESEVDAFILEPGYTFQYYGNISQTDWEPWEPEERPFLMIVEPLLDGSTGTVKAKTSFLAPHFEEGRVRMLGIPADEDLDIVVWEEHWNPYTTLLDGTFPGKKTPTVMVDEEIRDYIVRGLDANGFRTLGLTPTVDAVRQQKSPVEIDIIRAVNTGTVEAVRQMRPCLVPGLTEDQVTDILNNALLSVGFQLFFNIVLFEENAALPHGGFITGSKKLTYDTMVLIDVGAHYMGYSSDICRSFFIDPPSTSPSRSTFSNLLQNFLSYLSFPSPSPSQVQPPPFHQHQNTSLHALKLQIHDLVLSAQNATIPLFTPSVPARDLDLAARNLISHAGYGEYFTHRVGHGIGIKAHESPYLHQGNDVELKEGMVFTSEPGVYLTGRFGVRTEDVFVVRDGGGECLSGRRARGVYEP